MANQLFASSYVDNITDEVTILNEYNMHLVRHCRYLEEGAVVVAIIDAENSGKVYLDSTQV